MAYLVSLLPALACPLLMGLMMWFMMRGNKDQSGEQAHPMDARSPGESINAPQKSAMGGFHLCLNWNVVAGLAVLGLGIWVIAPNLAWAALPVLVVLACPLSMLFMMRGMGGGQRTTPPGREQQSVGAHRPREEQLLDLRGQHAAIAQEIAELESASNATMQSVEADMRTHDAHVHTRS
jgi:Protein of unknown function (DUF2933)